MKQSRRQFGWRSLRKRARSPLLKPNGQLTYRLTRLVALGTFGALTKLSCRLSTLHFQFQELCESRGGRPGLPVLMSLTVSVDVKQPWTMLTHWSKFVPNMSTDIRGDWALRHHHQASKVAHWSVTSFVLQLVSLKQNEAHSARAEATHKGDN